MSSLNDLSKRIALWINSFLEVTQSMIALKQVDHVTILAYWKAQMETIPFLVGPKGNWNDEQRDAHFTRILCDGSYFDLIHHIWKDQLQIREIPYFTELGAPTLKAKQSTIIDYIVARFGSDLYPSIDDLQDFSNLLKCIRTVRSYEQAIQSVHVEFCPCVAKQFGVAITNSRVLNTLDVHQRVDWCLTMSKLFNSPPKCPIHRSYIEQHSLDELDLSMSRRERSSQTRGRRSSSASGAFSKRQPIDTNALLMPLRVEQILADNISSLALGH